MRVRACGSAGRLFRLRAGRSVYFETISTIELERDAPAYAKLRQRLSNGDTACELKVTLTAERQLPNDSAGARAHLHDARFVLGEVKLDLRALLAKGSDLLERSLVVHSRARHSAVARANRPPTLIISLEVCAQDPPPARAGACVCAQDPPPARAGVLEGASKDGPCASLGVGRVPRALVPSAHLLGALTYAFARGRRPSRHSMPSRARRGCR